MDGPCTRSEPIFMNKNVMPPRPGAPRTVTVLSHVDGTQISVSAQPDTGAGTGTGPSMILLCLLPPPLSTTFCTYLAPDEACQLATALTDTALATMSNDDQMPVRDSGYSRYTAPPGTEHQELTITTREGSTVSDLCWMLGGLPPHARLVDFGSDTDVTLIFRADTMTRS
jgi:uncharacterized repeat protein (TIGR03917 family)